MSSQESLEAIERDVIQFLSKINEYKDQDRKAILMAIFQKHIVLNEGDLLLNEHDFNVIMGLASSKYKEMGLPVLIGRKKLLPNEATNLALIDAVVELLNSKGAIKRLPFFDRREK